MKVASVALPSLLTADDMASLLRVSRKAIYTMVDRGEIPGVTRIGKRLRFRGDDVLAWLDESRASSLKE
jgi:excisionase family DNA binding protein